METVSGKQDWYCLKNNEINHNRRGVKALGELYEENATFRDQWELDGDSIIAMAAKYGREAAKKAQLKQFSEELSAITSSSTKRSRGGFEYTLPMFEELCKEQPEGGRELKRKSEETLVCVRSGKGFRMTQKTIQGV